MKARTAPAVRAFRMYAVSSGIPHNYPKTAPV
jgi:hypothetical protein